MAEPFINQSHPVYFGRVEVTAETSTSEVKLSVVDNFSSKWINIVVKPETTCGMVERVEVGCTLNEVYFGFQLLGNADLLLYAYIHSEEVIWLSAVCTIPSFILNQFQALYTI